VDTGVSNDVVQDTCGHGPDGLKSGHVSPYQACDPARRRQAVANRARGGARHGAAAACAWLLRGQRTALAVGAAGRSRRAQRQRRGWIVEIKSSVADFRADQKWQDYRVHCDRLFFATSQDVPCEIFPPDTGLIVADAFGAAFYCEAPEHKLAAATRKSMLLLIARAAALRLQSLIDPNGPYGEFV